MDNLKANESVEFIWRRLTEDCPTWALLITPMFAFFVLALIVFFRPEGKLLTAIIGGAIIGVITLVYLPMAYLFKSQQLLSWMVILVPVMMVALFYVGLMYIRDAKSVHPLWAIFLGLIRCCVYLILSIVFLLPGCQYSDKQEYQSKILVLFDVSGSMGTKDGSPGEGQKLEDLPTRQDKIFAFLTAKFDENGREQTPFIQRLLAKSPVTAGRFGAVLDETDILHLNSQKTYTDEQWKKWLNPDPKELPKPNVEEIKDEKERQDKLAAYNARLDMIELLKSNTNIGGSALAMHKLENNSYIQAIIIISDGQSNLGSDEARTDFLSRVNNSKRMIPVMTVGVGEYRQPVSIRIDDIEVAEETRPEDMFPVRVPVVGQGLHGEPFTVKIEVTRVKDLNGQPVQEKTHIFPDKVGTFKGLGDNPQDLIRFEVDVGALKGIIPKDDVKGDLEGEWEIVARVPKHPKEIFDKPEHVTKPIKVLVQKRALRVLLFASGATREFQFLRTIIYREVLEKRMEMSILVQTGKEDHVDHSVPPERFLPEFPGRLGPNEAGRQFQSLNDYDVIVAFDPDWSRLGPKELNALREWVGTHAGSVIFVAGPVFSYQLARPGGRDISSLLAIFPVVLQDNRLHGLSFSGSGLGHDSSRPYPLNFPPNAAQFDFLKLDEAGDSPTAGWNGFFWNNEKDPSKDKLPRRGFYYYYPVERLKPLSNVAATFAGPKDSRIADKTDAFKDQQPFIVTMAYGQGKSMYLGSGEFWRLRGYKDGFHERFWIKAMRHVAAAGVQQKKYGRLLMPRSMPVGEVRVEAQIKGKDYLPLARDIIPHIIVKKIEKDQDDAPKDKEKEKEKEKPREKEGKVAKLVSFDLKAKESDGDWEGYFNGSYRITEPGEYEFQLPIPNTTEMLKQTLTVRKLRPELDNVRTNFEYLYQMSSEAETIFKKLPPDVKKDVEPLLQVPQDRVGVGGTTKRLFFPVSSADAISKCIVPIAPKTDQVKGRFEYLWDKGEKDVFWIVLFIPVLIGVIGAIILLIVGQPLGALMFFGICTLMTVLMGAAYGLISLLGINMPVEFSYVMMLVVGLLGIEWLSRKLLRLA